MRRKTIITMVAVLLVLSFATISALATGYPVAIKDATGTEVIIKEEPRRIVSIVPSVTEMLYAVGLGDRLVGVTAWCTYPEEAKKVDKVGDVNINIEAVLAKKPDLVVADTSMSGTTISKIRELGVKVLAIKADDIAGMLDALKLLGMAGGKEAQADALVASLSFRIEKVKAAIAKSKSRPSVFVEIWNEPLMTAGRGTYVDELIRLAGGRNIAEGVTGWPVFSQETVIKENPYLIILTNYNKAEVLTRKAWSDLAAVRSGRVIEANPDLLVRSGPRLVDGLEELAKLLHPEMFD